jgi:hypothetical protein
MSNETTNNNKPSFDLGQVVATPGALALGIDFLPYLAMHVRGYWGNVGQEDWQENDLSVKEGFRILSAYETRNGRIWIITESDRNYTTILISSEY